MTLCAKNEDMTVQEVNKTRCLCGWLPTCGLTNESLIRTTVDVALRHIGSLLAARGFLRMEMELSVYKQRCGAMLTLLLEPCGHRLRVPHPISAVHCTQAAVQHDPFLHALPYRRNPTISLFLHFSSESLTTLVERNFDRSSCYTKSDGFLTE